MLREAFFQRFFLRSFELFELSPLYFALYLFVFSFLFFSFLFISTISPSCGQIPSGHRNLSERVC